MSSLVILVCVLGDSIRDIRLAKAPKAVRQVSIHVQNEHFNQCFHETTYKI